MSGLSNRGITVLLAQLVVPEDRQSLAADAGTATTEAPTIFRREHLKLQVLRLGTSTGARTPRRPNLPAPASWQGEDQGRPVLQRSSRAMTSQGRQSQLPTDTKRAETEA